MPATLPKDVRIVDVGPRDGDAEALIRPGASVP